jgi:3-dehydroquinate synthase
MIIDVKLGNSRDYEIFIDSLQSIEIDTKVAIITNPKVSGLHLKYLLEKLSAKEIYIVTVPDGEEYKNMQTVEMVLDNLFNHKLDRKSKLIAFGGGVIGDMTGFIASLYQRGIDFIQVPTTLLAQVDSSVGGKTGVNNKYGKNLIGAFHQPKVVYIDPHFLSTLPPREFSAGVAEIIKMAVIFDKEFFAWLENNPLDLDNIENIKYAIKRSVELKADVVRQDEREGGVRAKLNYGHTFCHVIENETKYSTYLHGEAVAIGMVMANRLAMRLGQFDENEEKRVLALLEKYNLPITYNIKSVDDFYEKFFLDKKTSNSKIKFIVPNSIGDSVIRDDVDEDMVKSILDEYTNTPIV